MLYWINLILFLRTAFLQNKKNSYFIICTKYIIYIVPPYNIVGSYKYFKILNYFSKPSEHGSLVALHMALLSQEAGFPPGLVNTPLLDSFTFDSLIAKQKSCT